MGVSRAGWFQGRLQDWDFASLGFSLLPFFLCLTFLGSNLAGRTYLLLIYRSTPRFGSSDTPDLHKALTSWTSLPAYAATLLYVLALGPWGIAGNRLLSNIGSLLGR